MVASSPPIVRRAGPSDVGVVQQISADAYIPAYKAVIGAIPKPAFEDYTPRIQRGEVWILEVDGEAVGVAARRREPTTCWSTASRLGRRSSGKDMVQLSCSSQTSGQSRSVSRKSASTPIGGWSGTSPFIVATVLLR